MRGDVVFLFIFLYLNLQLCEAKHHKDWRGDTSSMFFWRRSEIEKCEPFVVFNVDCNRCVCNADGVAHCTKMACIDQLLLRPRSKTKSKKLFKNFELVDINRVNHNKELI